MIIIIRLQFGLDIPVSASSNNLLKGLPSRLLSFGLKFSMVLHPVDVKLQNCDS